MQAIESPRSIDTPDISTIRSFDHQSVGHRQLLLGRSNAVGIMTTAAEELRLSGLSNIEVLARPMMEGDRSVQVRLILGQQTRMVASIDGETGTQSVSFVKVGKEKTVVVINPDADTGDMVVSLDRSSKERPGVSQVIIEDEAQIQEIDIVPERANFSDANVMQKDRENEKLTTQVKFALALAGYKQ